MLSWGEGVEVAGLLYSNFRVNSRYHLEVLCIIKKLEAGRFISMLHNQVAAILLLFAVISGRGKKSRKFAMDSSVAILVPHSSAGDRQLY